MCVTGVQTCSLPIFYMTYTMAYGDEMIGVVPYRSPVAWFVSIDKVEKTD